MKTVEVTLKSVVPLLMNRYGGEKPPEAKPRKKTQEWIEQARKAKWMEAAHFENGQFIVTPDMIEGALFKAAARFRKKQDFKMAVMCVDLGTPLLVNRGDGRYAPVAGELEDFYIPEFIDIRGVPNASGQMVEQCRPIFRDWRVKFSLRFDEMIVNESEVKTACETMMLGSFLPRFGRSSLEEFKTNAKAKAA